MNSMQIPAHVEQIIHTLNSHGYEAFAVGGCVRDTLLGRKPGDWDITTSARPEQVKALFRRTIDTGIQHGTVTIMMDRTVMRGRHTALTASTRMDVIRSRWNLLQIFWKTCAAGISPSMPWPTAMRPGLWMPLTVWQI